jgi:hypothetical protein
MVSGRRVCCESCGRLHRGACGRGEAHTEAAAARVARHAGTPPLPYPPPALVRDVLRAVLVARVAAEGGAALAAHELLALAWRRAAAAAVRRAARRRVLPARAAATVVGLVAPAGAQHRPTASERRRVCCGPNPLQLCGTAAFATAVPSSAAAQRLPTKPPTPMEPHPARTHKRTRSALASPSTLASPQPSHTAPFQLTGCTRRRAACPRPSPRAAPPAGRPGLCPPWPRGGAPHQAAAAAAPPPPPPGLARAHTQRGAFKAHATCGRLLAVGLSHANPCVQSPYVATHSCLLRVQG